MPRPPFGLESEWGTCEVCGDQVKVPPGVYYRGLRMHKHCFKYWKQRDFGDEVLEPILEQTREGLDCAMENMGPMSEG